MMMTLLSKRFLLLALLAVTSNGFSIVTLDTNHHQYKSTRTPHQLRSNNNAITCLSALKFYYSPSSLAHLSALEQSSSTDKKSRGSTWTTQKTIAAGGALVGTAIMLAAASFLFDNRNDIIFFSSGMGGALGWTLLGGSQVRQDDLPADGGSDGVFVVDRPARLRSILDKIPSRNIVESKPQRDLSKARKYVEAVHGSQYLQELQDAVDNARDTGRLRRLVPSYARTLIDENSYETAISGVANWVDAVDHNGFALVRPPSHHACQQRGMGGCLLNGAAAAAYYALEKYQRVGILDIDAHFGNGIAHCVQEEPRIKYCSLHENAKQTHFMFSKQDPKDPRSPSQEDVGPLGNCLNIHVPTGATWDVYKELLVEQALVFLQEVDYLVVAAGFDALQADKTSGICLQPKDYEQLGLLLKKQFGPNRICWGLEGGYCWQEGELAEAVVSLVKPFS